MVPRFEDFFFPCLKCLSDGNVYTQKSLRNYVIQYFNLSEADVNAMIKSGRRTQVADRIAWTVSYFQQAGLIETLQRGCYKISQLGMNFLTEHSRGFDKADLLHIPSFADFATRKNSDSDKIAQKQSKTIHKEEYTPTDLIADAYRQINDSLAQDLLSKILELSPAFFERLVVELLVRMGYGGSFEDAASVTQYSRDDGVDGVIKEDKLGFDTIYIQAKRYDKNTVVGSKDIRDFIGALNIKHASKRVFITT